jgi:hypothetical protein
VCDEHGILRFSFQLAAADAHGGGCHSYRNLTWFQDPISPG